MKEPSVCPCADGSAKISRVSDRDDAPSDVNRIFRLFLSPKKKKKKRKKERKKWDVLSVRCLYTGDYIRRFERLRPIRAITSIVVGKIIVRQRTINGIRVARGSDRRLG